MVPSLGLTLIGQKFGINAKAIDGPIYSLIQDGDKLVVDETLPIPRDLMLFNFAFADLEGNGDWKILALDEYSKLRVMETSGKMLWKSQDSYGATKRFIGGGDELTRAYAKDYDEITDGKGDPFEKIYVNSRIVVKDLDQDGIDDVILNKNAATATAIVRDMQTFHSGMTMGMKWNGLGMEEIWQTKRIDGYVVDYGLESEHMETADGEDRLFVGVVTQSGMMNVLTNDSSTVLVYPFKAKKEAGN